MAKSSSKNDSNPDEQPLAGVSEVPQSKTELDDQTKTLDELLRIRAYEYWCERGSPEGSPEIDWFRAEDELEHLGS